MLLFSRYLLLLLIVGKLLQSTIFYITAEKNKNNSVITEKYTRKWVIEILHANIDKKFVQRILYSSRYPVIVNNDGSISTHCMAWGESDGKCQVFPTLIFRNGTLTKYDAYTAWGKAIKSNNYISFTDARDADWFSKNYKIVWRR